MAKLLSTRLYDRKGDINVPIINIWLMGPQASKLFMVHISICDTSVSKNMSMQFPLLTCARCYWTPSQLEVVLNVTVKKSEEGIIY